MIDEKVVRQHLPNMIGETNLDLPGLQRGKVRDVYDPGDGTLVVVVTDRISAFDILLTVVPFRGQILNELAAAWFSWTEDICPNHVITFPDPNVSICRKLDMLPIEIIVRDFLAGSTATSVWPMYERGARTLYGHKLPDGMRQNQRLPTTIVTPTTKAAAFEHDAPLSVDDIVSGGFLSARDWEEVQEISLALFRRGRDLAAEKGLILADTKYEFGWDEKGRLVLADEVHTPDSSRFWRADTYMRRIEQGLAPLSFDKDNIRRWVRAQCDPYREPIPAIPFEVIAETAISYTRIYEDMTGRPFTPPDLSVPAMERIRLALASGGAHLGSSH